MTPIDSGMDLYGIACLSGTQCVAVDQNGGEVTFDPQSGTASSVEPVDSGVALISVSCPSATPVHGRPSQRPGGAFNPQTGAVNSAGVKTVNARDFEDSVTCPTAKQCTTVDESGREVTFDPRTGTVNSRGAVPLESAVALTGKVSCPSAKQCTAGDQNGNEITFDPLPPAPSAPSISISRPRQNAAYTGGEVVDAEYSCTARPGSGPITLCSGSVASGSPISTSPGKHTFTVRASDKADKSSTLAHDYTVYARNGSGKMTASPSSVVHSTPHHTLRFTYEAARGGIARGTLILTVPAGWSTPSTSGAAPGSVKASQGRLSVSGRKIIVSIPILASAHTLTITYGSQAAGGPGATAPNTTGTQAWPAQERSIPQGTLTNIASPPHIAIT